MSFPPPLAFWYVFSSGRERGGVRAGKPAMYSFNKYLLGVYSSRHREVRQGNHVPCPRELLSDSCHSSLVNSRYQCVVRLFILQISGHLLVWDAVLGTEGRSSEEQAWDGSCHFGACSPVGEIESNLQSVGSPNTVPGWGEDGQEEVRGNECSRQRPHSLLRPRGECARSSEEERKAVRGQGEWLS